MNAKVQQLTDTSLKALIEEAQRRASLTGSPVLVSAARQTSGPESLLRLFGAADALGWHRTLWSHPSRQTWSVGAGSALCLKGEGPDRAAQVRNAHRAIMSTALVEAPDLPGVGPACFGGFSFESEGGPGDARSHAWRDYPDALFILPRFTFASLPGESWVTTNVLVDGDADPDALEASIAREWDTLNAAVDRSIAPSQGVSQEGAAPGRWLEMVGEALQLIEQGELGKVVLARQLRVSAQRPIDMQQVLGRLASAYPGCMLFAVGVGPATFLGATPELLVELAKGQVSATSLAGSAPRGATAEQDDLFARTLLREDKDLREHAYVVDAVRQALDGLCTGTTWDERPSVTKLETVQHLATTFRAIASPERHLLDLAERLHPTPAVGGTPQHRARQVIRELEQADRGWYAGPVGRLDSSGDGELGVAIRSGLVEGSQALLYAGAGIVNGSDPQQEWAETELKLAPLLSALAGEV